MRMDGMLWVQHQIALAWHGARLRYLTLAVLELVCPSA